MCSINNIRLISLVTAAVKVITALYIFGAGIYISSAVSIKQAFGIIFTNYGAGIALVGGLSAVVVYPTLKGIKKHNKFIILMCIILDSIIFALLVLIGLTFVKATYPLFPKDLQLDCSRYIRQTYTQEECLPFFNSDRTAGFRLFWEGFFSDKSNTGSFQVLSIIQDNACCGFFAPLQCLANTKEFPPAYLTEGVDSPFLSQRVICGNIPSYYPEQDNCLDYFDEAAIPPIVGGCDYDLGVSFCLSEAVDFNSRGCVSFVEDYASGLILPHAYAILALSAFNVIMITLNCCMWWKRKETDVFPAFENDYKYPEDYKRVRSPFEITPDTEILTREEFLPSQTKKFFDIDDPVSLFQKQKPSSINKIVT